MPQPTTKETSPDEALQSDGLIPPINESVEKEPDTFKKLIRDFALGTSQNPNSAPGLQFYVVFGAMFGFALALVVFIAIILGVINLFRG